MSLVKCFWSGTVGSIRFDNRIRTYSVKPTIPGVAYDVLVYNTESGAAYKILNNQHVNLTSEEARAIADFCAKNALEIVGSDPVFSAQIADLENIVSANIEETAKLKADTLNGLSTKLDAVNGNVPQELIFARHSRMHWVPDSNFWGLDVFASDTLEGGAVLSLREITCTNEYERGAFHLRTGALNSSDLNSKFLTGRPDGSLWWCGVQIAGTNGLNCNDVTAHHWLRMDEGCWWNDRGIAFAAGNNWNDNAGWVFRRWDADDVNLAGEFFIKTGRDRNGNTEKGLHGKPNGDLWWAGKKIADANGPISSNGRQTATYSRPSTISEVDFWLNPGSPDFTENTLDKPEAVTLHLDKLLYDGVAAVKVVELIHCSRLTLVGESGLRVIGTLPDKLPYRTILSVFFHGGNVASFRIEVSSV